MKLEERRQEMEAAILARFNDSPEAEKELLRSHELNRENRDNLHHLGRLFEARGDVARAEDYYVKGLAIQGPSVNPSEAALRALYEKRRGGIGGFDGYIDGLRGRDRAVRKEKILGERIAQPAAVPASALTTLDRRRLALPDIKGKTVVISFWGIWCGPCVREMPDVQKLHTQYATGPDVLVLTIDNDRNPDDVAPWMKERKFTFPVLLDDGSVSKAGIQAFPTTWFLDRDGRKVFEKRGWSERLVEEFSWRIEAKLADRPTPGDARHLHDVLEEYGGRRGLIVCSAPRPLQVTNSVTAIPWRDLPAALASELAG